MTSRGSLLVCLLLTACCGSAGGGEQLSCDLDGTYQVSSEVLTEGCPVEPTYRVTFNQVASGGQCYEAIPVDFATGLANGFISCKPGVDETHECDGYVTTLAGCFYTLKMNHVVFE